MVTSAADVARRPAPIPAATAPAARLWAPRLEHVWVGLAVLAAALASAIQPLEPIDYWWSISLGTLIRQLGAIPADDPLVFTPIRGPIVDGQWLARVILSALHDRGGIELTLTLRTLVSATAAVLLTRACRAAGAGPRLAPTVAALAVVLFQPGLAVRPQLLAVVPFLLIWQAGRCPPRTRVGVLGTAAVAAFWANVHGSFILLYPLLGLGILDALVQRFRATAGGSADPARLRRALVVAAACGIAPILNPYGPGLASYVGDAILFNGGATSVGVLGVEWGQPALRSGYGGLFYASGLLAVGLLAARRRPRLAEGLLLLGFGLLALSSVRHILWWSLVLAPFVARGIHELSEQADRWRLPRMAPLPPGSPALNALCVVLFGALVVASLPWWRERLPLPPERSARLDPETPVAVGEYLAANAHGTRLFNNTDWSAYLSWRLGPEVRVFVDNRFELHPAEIWDDYFAISRGHVSWERRLDRWGVTHLALGKEAQAGLIEAVGESPGWRLVYEDQQAMVFERAAPVVDRAP